MSVLLLLIAASALLVTGLLLGRYYVPDIRPLKQAAEEGAFYIRGLNHVLAHDPDAAIAELTRAVESNTRTIETYFALGVLFRERGEYDRAVRVHQAILVRADLRRELKVLAQFQLGLDFESAGFRRRALEAFEQILREVPRHRGAAEKLLAYHEAEGRWEQAHQALTRLIKITGEKRPVHESHLLVEHGLARLEQGERGEARSLLKRALSLVPDGVHALHGWAVYHQVSGQPRTALETWARALTLAPDLASFFHPFLEQASTGARSREPFLVALDHLMAAHPGNVHLRLVRARLVGLEDPAKALGLLRELLAEAPALLPAHRLAGRLVLAGADPEAVRAEYERLLGTLDQVERDFRCARCGHTDRNLFWRCPKCHAWDSVRVAWGRRAGEGGDRSPGTGPAIVGGPADRRNEPRRATTAV